MKFARMMMAAVLGLAAAAALAAGLTQESVQTLMRAADAASSQMDVDAIGATLSDDAVIEVTMSVKGEKKTTKMNKQEYLESLRQMMEMLDDYSCKNENEQISLSGDTATVTSDVTETLTIGGQTMRSKARQTVIVKLVNGKPLVARMSGVVM